jgi:hypothetical protein
MSALLPHVVHQAVAAHGIAAASASLGLIAFVTLVLVLIERDTLAGRRSTGAAVTAFTAVAFPLAVAVFVMLVVRVFVLAD